METQSLIRQLEFEYYAIQAANPDWEASLYDFLKQRGIADDDIADYSPAILEEVGQPLPDWL